jgi:two-component system, LuxR family, response regulator FixJ
MKPTAFVVDDDEAIRTLWRWLMESNGIGVRTFANAAEFIAAYDGGTPGCLVLDLKLPGMSGLELQEYLVRERIGIPIVIVTGHADVPTAVTALKSGAVDLIEKPFDYRDVVSVVRKAFARDAENRERRARDAQIRARIASLTDRERAVLQRVMEGKANKVIAGELDISIKTVEVHRSKVMEKMGVGSVAELVQVTLGFSPMDGVSQAR